VHIYITETEDNSLQKYFLIMECIVRDDTAEFPLPLRERVRVRGHPPLAGKGLKVKFFMLCPALSWTQVGIFFKSLFGEPSH
jgi:hypothetical protein